MKTKPVKRSGIKTTVQPWGAFTLESDESRITRLRYDLLLKFIDSSRPYGKENGPITRAEMELWSKDAIVIADIIFKETK